MTQIPWHWHLAWVLPFLYHVFHFLNRLGVFDVLRAIAQILKGGKMLPNQIPAAAPEVVALGSALNDFLAAIKSGKDPVTAAKTASADLIAGVTGVSNIGTDIQQAHNQAFLAWSVAQVYEPEA